MSLFKKSGPSPKPASNRGKVRLIAADGKVVGEWQVSKYELYYEAGYLDAITDTGSALRIFVRQHSLIIEENL